MIELPPTVKHFFEWAASRGFEVERGNQQVMLWYRTECGRRKKVGGWNTKKEHWYVSKTLAGAKGAENEELMNNHGFRWEENPHSGHTWWQIDGADNTSKFRALAMELLQGPGSRVL